MSELRICAVCNAPVGPGWNRCEEHRHEYSVFKPKDFSTFTHPLSRPEYAALKPDHGVTPAQLREKVEELDRRVCAQALLINKLADGLHMDVFEAMESLEEKVKTARFVADNLLHRLDAALKRLDVHCAAISATASIAIGTVSDRLDSALNRIDALEAQQSMWRGNKRPMAPIDSEDI